MRVIGFSTLIWGVLLTIFLEGAYPSASPSQPQVDALRHQVSNQEIEIRAFEQKLENLQSILDSVQDQIQTTSTAQKDQLKNSSNSLEEKIAKLESAAKGLTADLQQLKNHANETTSALQAYKKTLLEYDQRFKQQNQNIDNLSAALQAVLDALQIKTDLPQTADATAPVKVYKIKNGDSLDKIARAQGTTVKELMRLNNMTSPDKIVVGKTLKITE
jgi:peptidoglycan endopeptidase LytF